jgi:hypothetical protein
MLGYAPLPHLERCRCCPRIIDPQQCPVGCKELRQHNPDLILAQVRLSPIRSQSADYNIPAQIRDIVLTRLPWLIWKGSKHSQAPNIPYQHAIMCQRIFFFFPQFIFLQITLEPIHPPSYTIYCHSAQVCQRRLCSIRQSILSSISWSLLIRPWPLPRLSSMCLFCLLPSTSWFAIGTMVHDWHGIPLCCFVSVCALRLSL